LPLQQPNNAKPVLKLKAQREAKDLAGKLGNSSYPVTGIIDAETVTTI
jgi:hypothetical protein